VFLLWKGESTSTPGKWTDDRTGVREAINWLYIRVQNARKM
jgi:hypothetical protein